MTKITREKREKQNYLIIDLEEKEEPLWVSMIKENKIQGIAAMSVRIVDNCRYYYYDITGLESLETYISENEWKEKQLWEVLQKIGDILEKGKEYLLEEDGYLLEPQQIFIDDFGEVQLIYVGKGEENIKTQLQGLGEFIIQNISHKDRNLQKTAYAFYDTMMEKGSLHALQDFLKNREGEKTGSLASVTQSKREEEEKEKNWYLAWQQDTRNGLLRFFFGSKSQPLIELKKFPCIIGRGTSSDYCIQNTGISRSHIRIEKTGQKLYATDLHSRNGTWLNGKKMQAGIQTRLKAGDRLVLAGEVFCLRFV